MNWISIEDEVPSPEEFVLICNDKLGSKRDLRIGKVEKGRFGGWASSGIRISHWQLLPELPPLNLEPWTPPPHCQQIIDKSVDIKLNQ